MVKTKKVGSTGRWGARYGLMLRKRVLVIEQVQRAKHKCPFCLKFTAKRLASGIWQCKHCKAKFAGKAYEPGITGKPMLEIPAALIEQSETEQAEQKAKKGEETKE